MDSVKKRTGRKRSQYGCRNCKLRKLKCDETKPSCKRCQIYGVLCNLQAHVGDLQPVTEQLAPQTAVSKRRLPLPPPRRSIGNTVWADDGIDYFFLDAQDQELFRRFRCRTVYSIHGAPLVDVYKSFILQTALSCPFLVHGLLALTAVHDRYLGIAPPSRRSLRECYHYYHCTAQFNKWLCQPIDESRKDAIWAAASILGILAFCTVHVSQPEEAWPLRPSQPSDFEWLNLSAAKMRLWKLVDPLRPTSAFRETASIWKSVNRTLPSSGADGVPAGLERLCQIDKKSTPSSNPYFIVAHSMRQLFSASPGEATLGEALLPMRHMRGAFQTRLMDKDPVALLLLCQWYSRARKVKWWVDLRTQYEVPAICKYLQRFHGHDSTLQEFMPVY